MFGILLLCICQGVPSLVLLSCVLHHWVYWNVLFVHMPSLRIPALLNISACVKSNTSRERERERKRVLVYINSILQFICKFWSTSIHTLFEPNKRNGPTSQVLLCFPKCVFLALGSCWIICFLCTLDLGFFS